MIGGLVHATPRRCWSLAMERTRGDRPALLEDTDGARLPNGSAPPVHAVVHPESCVDDDVSQIARRLQFGLRPASWRGNNGAPPREESTTSGASTTHRQPSPSSPSLSIILPNSLNPTSIDPRQPLHRLSSSSSAACPDTLDSASPRCRFRDPLFHPQTHASLAPAVLPSFYPHKELSPPEAEGNQSLTLYYNHHGSRQPVRPSSSSSSIITPPFHPSPLSRLHIIPPGPTRHGSH